jgi:integrase
MVSTASGGAPHWLDALDRLGRPGAAGRRRHTMATLALNEGVGLEVVSATLGHAGINVTANIYAKVRPKLQKQAGDGMERGLDAR